jgi:hypothetical protein
VPGTFDCEVRKEENGMFDRFRRDNHKYRGLGARGRGSLCIGFWDKQSCKYGGARSRHHDTVCTGAKSAFSQGRATARFVKGLAEVMGIEVCCLYPHFFLCLDCLLEESLCCF